MRCAPQRYGGAAVLGLESEVGSLESGKWADLCCVDLSGPGTQPIGDPLAQLVFGGARDIVSDVWVAGRQLLSGGELTRLDWSDVAGRSASVGRSNGCARLTDEFDTKRRSR